MAGKLWLADMVVLGMIACAVFYLGTLGSLTEDDMTTVSKMVVFLTGYGKSRLASAERNRARPGDGRGSSVRRSRIVHYVAVARMKSTDFLARESESPFERALLVTPGWKNLSADGLREVVGRVEAPAPPDEARR